jgi:hypothetical protein
MKNGESRPQEPKWRYCVEDRQDDGRMAERLRSLQAQLEFCKSKRRSEPPAVLKSISLKQRH